MDSHINKKSVVISAINFSEGGPLTVFQDCLSSAVEVLGPEWKIIALVHNKTSFTQNRVQYVEFSKAKCSWFFRLSYEWIFFYNLSIKIRPDLWFSLHDVTPLVRARRQALYCHNPAPFYSISWREIKLSPVFWIFTLLYKYLYRLFIKRNNFVIVQQEWLRNSFIELYGKLPFVVAYPSLNFTHTDSKINKKNRHIFFFPSIPRVFKNFEVICEAAKILEKKNISSFEIRLTIDGTENPYSKWVVSKYKNVKNVRFIGLQNKVEMDQQYKTADAVIFPSKLETWGLPISEAKLHNKALLLADLPYAHETVGNYDNVSFFSAEDSDALADLMLAMIENRWQPIGSSHKRPEEPFAPNWDVLWEMLIKDL